MEYLQVVFAKGGSLFHCVTLCLCVFSCGCSCACGVCCVLRVCENIYMCACFVFLPGVLPVCLCFQNGSDLESGVFMCVGVVGRRVRVAVCVFVLVHSCVGNDVAAGHWSVSSAIAPSWVSHLGRTLCTFHTCYRHIQSRYLENGPIWNEVLAELRCFRELLLLLSSSWWLPWKPCLLQSDASLHAWALAHSFWPRETVAQVVRTLEKNRFRLIGPHSARESALVSVLLEVESVGYWRPWDCLNQHSEAEDWEQDTGPVTLVAQP